VIHERDRRLVVAAGEAIHAGEIEGRARPAPEAPPAPPLPAEASPDAPGFFADEPHAATAAQTPSTHAQREADIDVISPRAAGRP
jgi:hypothetical protein